MKVKIILFFLSFLIPQAIFALEAKNLIFYQGNFQFDKNTKIYTDEQYRDIAEFFLDGLKKIADFQQKLVKTEVYTFTNVKQSNGNIIFVDCENKLISDIKQKYEIGDNNEEGFWIIIKDNHFIVGLTPKSKNFVKNTLKELTLMSNIVIRGQNLYLLFPETKLIDYPMFKIRALHITLFDTLNINRIKKTIDLAYNNKFNFIIMVVNNGILYDSHPEISKKDALSKDKVKELIKYAKDREIKIIPEINLLSHQEWLLSPVYPEIILKEGILSHSPNMFHTYDPKNENVYKIVYDIIEEVIDVFKPEYIHIGHDEALGLRVFNEPESYQLFAEHINKIHKFLSKKGIKTIIWGDMLRKDHNGLEKGLYKAIDLIPKDIIICNWYYKDNDFSSIDYFTQKGFNVLASTFKDERTITKLSNHLKNNPNLKVMGMVATTWYYLPWNKMELLERLIEVSGKNFW